MTIRAAELAVDRGRELFLVDENGNDLAAALACERFVAVACETVLYTLPERTDRKAENHQQKPEASQHPHHKTNDSCCGLLDSGRTHLEHATMNPGYVKHDERHPVRSCAKGPRDCTRRDPPKARVIFENIQKRKHLEAILYIWYSRTKQCAEGLPRGRKCPAPTSDQTLPLVDVAPVAGANTPGVFNRFTLSMPDYSSEARQAGVSIVGCGPHRTQRCHLISDHRPLTTAHRFAHSIRKSAATSDQCRRVDDFLWPLCQGILLCFGFNVLSFRRLLVDTVCSREGGKPATNSRLCW